MFITKISWSSELSLFSFRPLYKLPTFVFLVRFFVKVAHFKFAFLILILYFYFSSFFRLLFAGTSQGKKVIWVLEILVFKLKVRRGRGKKVGRGIGANL